jgi:2-amino-4-hydroxy-6-hydroxymethyldihydropteridine diphosphokinase
VRKCLRIACVKSPGACSNPNPSRIDRGVSQFVIGLGSSLGDRHRWLCLALRALDAQPGIQVEAISRIVETYPLGGVARCRFLNLAARIDTGRSPRSVLAACQDVESRCGRVRRLRYADRTIDLDLLWWSGGEVADGVLCVPHPELWRRPFAWRPLLEVLPGDVHLVRPEDALLKAPSIDRGPLAVRGTLGYFPRLATPASLAAQARGELT